MNLKLTFLFVACLAITPEILDAQADNSAVTYMNEIFNPVNDIKSETWSYLRVVTRGKSARKVDNKRQALLAKLKSTKIEVNRAGGYQSDDSLKNAVVEYLDLYYIVLKEDYDKILDMEDIAEQSYDLMEAYILAQKKAGEKLESSFDSVKEAQTVFAAKNNITLIESTETDAKSEKISKASDLLDYYNEIYLMFFRVYKQEAYVLNAMSNNDLVGLEQNNSTLNNDATQAIEKVKKVKPYLGDVTLKSEAQTMMAFYKDESVNVFPIISDYYIKKDNFEKIQKSFDAMRQKDRKQADIDKFNNAVNEFNAAVELVNKTNEISNEKRKKSLKNWNKAVEGFFEKHSS